MTKRRPKSSVTHSRRVYLVDRKLTEDFYLALNERYYVDMLAGKDAIAKSLAADLRKESPRREFLNMLALMLDPNENCFLKLDIRYSRRGKMWSRHHNDVQLAKATHKHWKALGGKRGQFKLAVDKVAEHFEVSKHTVRKALRNSK